MTQKNNYGGTVGSSFTTQVRQPQVPQYPQYPRYNQVARYPSYTPYTPYDQQLNEIRRRKNQAALNTQYPVGQNPLSDPFAINSLADVIFNTAAKDKKYGTNTNWIEKTTRALFDHTNDNFVKPILKGDFVSPFVNSLVSLGKDLDILSNPIKGMVTEAKVGKEGWIVGGIAAAVGGAAAALSGPVGWAAILGAGLASGGVAAAGTALVKDKNAALLGFKRGLGTTDEGRYTYNIETGNLITNVITEIVLDPFSWASLGGMAIQKHVTPAMKTLLASSKADGVELSMKQMWNMSESLMDYLHLGTRSMGKMDGVFTKMAYNATPIGLTWKATTGVRQSTSTLVNRIKSSMFGSADIKLSAFNPVDNSEKTKALVQLKNHDRVTQNFARDINKAGFGEQVGRIPTDLKYIEDYTKTLFEQATHKNLHKDAALAYVTHNLEDAVKFGVKGLPQFESVASQGFSDLLRQLPQDSVRKFVTDFVAMEDGSRTMVEEAYRAAEFFGRKLFKDVPENATKLDVLNTLEESFGQTLGSKGIQLKDMFAAMGGGDISVMESYGPLIDAIGGVIEKYNIPFEDFVAFLRRGDGDLEVINRLAEELADFGGLGAYKGGKVDVKKMLSKSDASKMEIFRGVLDADDLTPSSVLKFLGEKEGSVITVAEASKQESIKRMFSFPHSKSKNVYHETQKIFKVLDEFKKFGIPLETSAGFQDMADTFLRFERAIKSKDGMELTFKKLNSLLPNSNMKLDPLDLNKSIEALRTAITKSGVKLNSELLLDLNKLTKAATMFEDMPTLLGDISKHLDHLQTSSKKLITPMVGKVKEADIQDLFNRYNGPVKRLTDMFEKFTPDSLFNGVSEMGKRNMYMLQASKQRQFMAMAMDAVDASPKFFEEVLDPDSLTSKMYRNVIAMDTYSAGFDYLKNSYEEVYRRVGGNHTFLDFADTLNRGVNMGKFPETISSPVMDVIVRSSHMDPKLFLESFDENVMQNLRYNLSSAGIRLSDVNQDEIVSLLQQYATKMMEIGAPAMVYIPGSGFETHIKRLMDNEMSSFLDGLVDHSQKLARASELQSLSDGVLASITRIRNANDQLNTMLYVSERADSVARKNIDSIIGRADIGTDAVFKESALNLGTKVLPREAFPTIEEKMRGDLASALQKVLDKDSAIDIQRVQNLVTPDNIAQVSRALTDHYEDGFLKALDNVAGRTIKEEVSSLAKLQKSNTVMLTKVTDSSDALLKLGAAEGALGQKGSLTAIQRSQADTLLTMPPEDLASFIKYNTNSGFLVMTNDIMSHSFDPGVLEELSKYGVILEEGRNYTVLKKITDTADMKALSPSKNKYATDLGMYLETPDKNLGSQVEVLNELYEDMFKQVGKESPLSASTHAPIRFDYERVQDFIAADPELTSMLGGPEAVIEYLKTIQRSRGMETSFIGPFEFLQNLGGVDPESGRSMLTSSILTSNFRSALSLVDQNHDTIRWFNVLSDQAGRLDSVLSGVDSKMGAQLFKDNKEMVAAYFGADMKVRKINIRNAKDFDIAVANKAVLTDASNYSMMYRDLNKYQLKNLPGGKVLDVWRANVQTPFSAAYLSTPGAVFRNWFDATSKNIIMTGNGNVLGTQMSGYKMLRDVGKIVNKLEGDLSEPLVDKMIKSMTKDDFGATMLRAKFDLVREYVDSAASGGELQSVIERQMRSVIESGGKAHKPTIIQKLSYDNPVSKFFLDGFSGVEDMARFGLFLDLRKQGLSASDVLYKVMETHFDYTTRAPWELYLQQVIPFITFPMKNFMWWAEHAYDNPLILRHMTNSVTNSYVNDEYRSKTLLDPEKGAFNRNQLLSGNPQQRNGDYNTLFKLNPSVFDAFGFLPGMITDPTERVAAPIKNIYKSMTGQVEKWDDLEYPAQANIKRFAKMVTETGPKVLGGIQGKDEDWRFGPALLGSIFNVTKYEPKEWAKTSSGFTNKWIDNKYGNKSSGNYEYKKYDKRAYSKNVYHKNSYGKRAYHKNDYGDKEYADKTYHKKTWAKKSYDKDAWAKKSYFKYAKKSGSTSAKGRTDYGAPTAYTAKGGGNALSTGFVTKYGKFRSSGGIGYGNAQHSKNRDTTIRFGRSGAYLGNAPDGVYLKNLQWKQRTVYNKMYTKSGNSKLVNRTRTIKDARGLMFRLQDMKYNMF